MVENKVCKGCKYNKYPICEGIKMFDGNYMNIENLKESFNCGQKNDTIVVDFSIVKKTEEELIIEDIEARLIELEKITPIEK